MHVVSASNMSVCIMPFGDLAARNEDGSFKFQDYAHNARHEDRFKNKKNSHLRGEVTSHIQLLFWIGVFEDHEPVMIDGHSRRFSSLNGGLQLPADQLVMVISVNYGQYETGMAQFEKDWRICLSYANSATNAEIASQYASMVGFKAESPFTCIAAKTVFEINNFKNDLAGGFSTFKEGLQIMDSWDLPLGSKAGHQRRWHVGIRAAFFTFIRDTESNAERRQKVIELFEDFNKGSEQCGPHAQALIDLGNQARDSSTTSGSTVREGERVKTLAKRIVNNYIDNPTNNFMLADNAYMNFEAE